MKKKYVLGSIVCILLMLVSTQLFIAPIATSTPSRHTGDAEIGEIRLSELDVSSHIGAFNDLAIPHVIASNDWVLWENQKGNIIAGWSIDIQSQSHPEYEVVFGFGVYHADCMTELGVALHMVTIPADEQYCDDGVLEAFIDLTEYETDSMLYCSMGAFLRLVDASEAEGFTFSAADRAIVAVDFDAMVSRSSFDAYLEGANELIPAPFTYIEGWENHFVNQSEMLDQQTTFEIGDWVAVNGTSQTPTWSLGEIQATVKKHYLGPFFLDDLVWVPHEKIGYFRDVDGDPNRMRCDVRYNVSIQDDENSQRTVYTLLRMWKKPRPGTFIHDFKPQKLDLIQGNNKEIYTEEVDVFKSNVSVGGLLWVFFNFPRLRTLGPGYEIRYDSGLPPTSPGPVEAPPYSWIANCAYANFLGEELNLGYDTIEGVTYIRVDIASALGTGGSPISTFAADRGNTRVQFIA